MVLRFTRDARSFASADAGNFVFSLRETPRLVVLSDVLHTVYPTELKTI